METFGKYLERFTLSVDIVREETKKRITKIIQEYLKDTLGIEFFTFHLVGDTDNGIGLFTVEVEGGRKLQSRQIKDEEGNYMSQVSLAYSLKKPLWIVDSEQNLLKENKRFTDLWSKVPSGEIPNYSESSNFPSKTSIIIPIIDKQEKAIGVINLESIRYLEISELLKTEIRLIIDCFKKIHFRNELYAEQKEDTDQAVEDLAKIRTDGNLISISRPQVFLASAYTANSDVISVINTLFREEIPDFRLESWKNKLGTGIINLEILNKIKACDHGIFYVSQPTNNNSNQYEDNQNVLIEAGMMSYKSNQFENIIIIREEQSVKEMPFDLHPIKKIYIRRDKDSQLDRETFQNELKTLTKRMLGIN